MQTETQLVRNKSVPISSRSHLNLTLNIYHCGNHDLLPSDHFAFFEKDTFCLLMVNEGTLRLTGDCTNCLIEQGRGMVAFPEQNLRLQNEKRQPANVTWVNFSGYLVDVYLSRANISAQQPKFEDDSGVLLTYLNMLYTRSLHMPNRYCRMTALLYDIFSELLDKYPTRPGADGGYNDMYYVIRALDRIESGAYRDGRVEELAQALGITRKHMSAAFRGVLGVTAKKYIILYRMEQACAMLRTSVQPISEVAELVGYADQFHFAKEFRRITGVTPTEYRSGRTTAIVPECTKLKESLINRLSGRNNGITG